MTCFEQEPEVRPLKLTAAMIREYDYRELRDPPFDRFTAPGEYELTEAEAGTVRLDAEFHGDVNGCSGIEHHPSVKAMYRRIHDQLHGGR